MKQTFALVIFAFLAGLALQAWRGGSEMTARVEQLAAENERLRLFNAREARRHRLHKGEKQPVPEEALELARHITGCSPEAIRGVYLAEDGPPDIETGILGKTDFFAQHLPMKAWPAVEAGRTLNIYAWKWLTQTAEGRKALKKILTATAGPYTQVSPARQKKWVETIMQQVEPTPIRRKP